MSHSWLFLILLLSRLIVACGLISITTLSDMMHHWYTLPSYSMLSAATFPTSKTTMLLLLSLSAAMTLLLQDHYVPLLMMMQDASR